MRNYGHVGYVALCTAILDRPRYVSVKMCVYKRAYNYRDVVPICPCHCIKTSYIIIGLHNCTGCPCKKSLHEMTYSKGRVLGGHYGNGVYISDSYNNLSIICIVIYWSLLF
jgi:hypothetical protein